MAINFPDSPTANVTTHAANGITWLWDGTTWISQGTSGGVAYSDTDVDTHLNTSSANSGEILSWNGTDYAWTTDQTGSGGGGGSSDFSGLTDTPANFTGHGKKFVKVNVSESGLEFVAAPTITDFSWTAPSVADDATTQINITGYKAYTLFKITSTVESWIRLYVDDATRDADAVRGEGNDPAPGSGVICEVRTTGPNQSVILTPACIGYDNEGTNKFFLAVTNKSGATANIQITLTALQLGD
jgi:hypothetical protein